jgi:hypothetical protein
LDDCSFFSVQTKESKVESRESIEHEDELDQKARQDDEDDKAP